MHIPYGDSYNFAIVNIIINIEIYSVRLPLQISLLCLEMETNLYLNDFSIPHRNRWIAYGAWLRRYKTRLVLRNCIREVC